MSTQPFKLANFTSPKGSLNPSAATFMPFRIPQPPFRGIEITPLTMPNTELDSKPMTENTVTDREAPKADSEKLNAAESLLSSTEKLSSSTKSPKSILKDLERSLYSITRPILNMRSWKNVICFGETTAQYMLKRYSDQFRHLTGAHTMDELSKVLVSMHSLGVFQSNPETVQQKWPWLLETTSPATLENNLIVEKLASSPAHDPEPTFQTQPIKTDDIRDRLFKTLKSNFEINGPSSELSTIDDNKSNSQVSSLSESSTIEMDLNGARFPYPTQRVILKESQSIVKLAFYKFLGTYFPERLSHEDFEYPESSPLSHWVLLIQEALDDAGDYLAHAPADTHKKILQLRNSGETLFAAVIDLYDIVLNRKKLGTTRLQELLSKIGIFLITFGNSECITRHEVLDKYTQSLASDLEMKLGPIQKEFKDNLQMIEDKRKKLGLEEKSLVQYYHKKEKALMKDYMIDANVLQTKISIPEGNRTKLASVTGMGDETLLSLFLPKPLPAKPAPEIFVWNPEKSLVEYQGLGEPVTESRCAGIENLPWGSLTIDDAITDASEKNSLGEKSNDGYLEIARSLNIKSIKEDPDLGLSKTFKVPLNSVAVDTGVTTNAVDGPSQPPHPMVQLTWTHGGTQHVETVPHRWAGRVPQRFGGGMR